MKCANCKLMDAKDNTNFCSQDCLSEYMIKDLIFFNIKREIKK